MSSPTNHDLNFKNVLYISRTIQSASVACLLACTPLPTLPRCSAPLQSPRLGHTPQCERTEYDQPGVDSSMQASEEGRVGCPRSHGSGFRDRKEVLSLR